MEKTEQQYSHTSSTCSCKTTLRSTKKPSILDDLKDYLSTLQSTNYANAKSQTLVQINTVSVVILTENHN